MQKTHVARLKFPAPATMETWVTDQDGDPVFMVIAEPSDSLAATCGSAPGTHKPGGRSCGWA